MSADDIPLVNAYWANLTSADCDRMSIDPAMLPTRVLTPGMLQQRRSQPVRERTVDTLIWELNGRAVGQSTLSRIRYGEYGEIHLHMIDEQCRRSGYGLRFFVLTLQEFFRRFDLPLIVCEPSARNAGPNRLLQRLGFTIARSYRTRPSDITLEHEVNRYEITRTLAHELLNR